MAGQQADRHQAKTDERAEHGQQPEQPADRIGGGETVQRGQQRRALGELAAALKRHGAARVTKVPTVAAGVANGIALKHPGTTGASGFAASIEFHT